jgi:hypothetical protein
MVLTTCIPICVRTGVPPAVADVSRAKLRLGSGREVLYLFREDTRVRLEFVESDDEKDIAHLVRNIYLCQGLAAGCSDFCKQQNIINPWMVANKRRLSFF